MKQRKKDLAPLGRGQKDIRMWGIALKQVSKLSMLSCRRVQRVESGDGSIYLSIMGMKDPLAEALLPVAKQHWGQRSEALSL